MAHPRFDKVKKKTSRHPPTRNSPGKRRSERKFEQKKPLPPAMNKSEVRINFQKHYKKAVDYLKKSNRPQNLEQLFETLCMAEKHLIYCFDERPTNRYLKLQLKIVQEEKKDILRTRRHPDHPIPLILDPKWRG